MEVSTKADTYLHSYLFCCLYVVSFLYTFKNQTQLRWCDGIWKCPLAQLPSHSLRPRQPLLVSLKAINSAAKPHAAPIPKCHLMVSGSLRVQVKKVYFFKREFILHC